jgi:hypothetical protein
MRRPKQDNRATCDHSFSAALSSKVGNSAAKRQRGGGRGSRANGTVCDDAVRVSCWPPPPALGVGAEERTAVTNWHCAAEARSNSNSSSAATAAGSGTEACGRYSSMHVDWRAPFVVSHRCVAGAASLPLRWAAARRYRGNEQRQQGRRTADGSVAQ